MTVCVLTHSVTFDSLRPRGPGSPDHGVSQANMLEWVAISFSRGSSQPRDQTRFSCLTGDFFTAEPPCDKAVVVWEAG